MGVVYYANYLKYFEMCRAELLRQLGYPYSCMEQEGFAMPVVEAVCHYKRPAKFEDQLTITAFVAEFRAASVQIGCTVKRGDELLAEGHTLHACLNAQGKPSRLPKRLMEILNSGKTETC